jgi:uncharacterized protein YdhG (YjbR/CyaY superfamily)
MPAKDADAYLAKLSAEKRATLEKVRKAIRAAAPDAEEGMSYGMPAFIQGKPLAGYNASANHCSYFPMSGAITAQFRAELKNYDVSKGGFRFPIGKPPPAVLIRKLVKARLAEIETAKPAAKKVNATDRFDLLGHPLRKDIDAVRTIVTEVSPKISEGVKWNAPSFRTDREWFATINLRSQDSVQIILHLGARARPNQKAFKVADPNHLMKWLGKDRAMVTLGAGRDIGAHRKAFEAIVRTWIKYL